MPVRITKRQIQDKLFGNTKNTAMDVQLREMANARLGIVYALGNTEMNSLNKFKANPVSALVIDTQVVKDAAAVGKWAAGHIISATDLKQSAEAFLLEHSALNHAAKAVSGFAHELGEIKATIKRYLSEFFQKMLDMIKQRYNVSAKAMSVITDFIFWLTNTFAGSLADVIPGWGYARSAVALYGDVRKGILNTKDLISQLYSGYGVKLLGGHPSVIANALARHNVAGIAGAAKGLAFTGANLGLTIAGDAAGGAGMIVSIITGLLTRIFNLIEYNIQRYHVGSVLDEAAHMWHRRSNTRSRLYDHKRFSEWFQESVVMTPVIASLAMSSGFAAHPYRFMQLLDTAGGVTMEADFAKGVKHIENLKKLAASHVKGFSDGYNVQFSSTEGIIEARLKEIQTGKSKFDDYEFVLYESDTINDWDDVPKGYDEKWGAAGQDSGSAIITTV